MGGIKELLNRAEHRIGEKINTTRETWSRNRSEAQQQEQKIRIEEKAAYRAGLREGRIRSAHRKGLQEGKARHAPTGGRNNQSLIEIFDQGAEWLMPGCTGKPKPKRKRR